MRKESNAGGGAAQGIESEVHRLLATGKCKQAVELAKDHHKKAATPASQQLLVGAYVARIEQFQNKGMAQEAQTLLTLVRERFPSEVHRLGAMEIRAAAAGGRVSDLLRPLGSSQTPPEVRVTIEETLARHVIDLPAVAACDALPPDHPLRTGASAVWNAFLAVTRGPVTDADISLPEVSHRSPLAAWKLLIRAIAAFYIRDDAGCRRALDAIPSESAAAHMAWALRAMVDANKPASGVAAALYSRVLGSDEALRTALERIQLSFQNYYLPPLVGDIRDAMRACAACHPGLLEKLRQHIYAGCAAREAPFAPIRSALGPVEPNAYFWRLMAHGAEANDLPVSMAGMYWERFLRHAVAEELFAASSAEAVTIWLHIADLLSHCSLEDLENDRQVACLQRWVSRYYDGHPDDLDVSCRASEREIADAVLGPGQPFHHATRIRPDAEIFRRWWAWGERVGLPEKEAEHIALCWHHGLTRDPEPLVLLSSLAESRRAFSLAIKRLEEAEAIDPLHKHVRKAKVRLTLAITWRHFADRKAHLVEKDLAPLAALPGMDEGDRAGVLSAICGAWHRLRGDQAGEAACVQSLVDRVGPLAGPVVFNSILRMAKFDGLPVPMMAASGAQPLEIALTQARLVRIAEDLRLKLFIPVDWAPVILNVLRQQSCPISSPDLLSIGRGAVGLSDMELAYLASSVGLSRTDTSATVARFLMLRARSLDQTWHQPRPTQCLRAALVLARQAHDEQLVNDIFSQIDRDPFSRRIISGASDGKGMPEDIVQLVLEMERKAGEFPKSRRDIDPFVARGAVPDATRRFGFDDEYNEWEDDEDDDLNEEEEEEEVVAGLFDMLPPLPTDSDALPDGLPPTTLSALASILEASEASSVDELMEKPDFFVEAMAKAIGQKLSPAQKRALVDELTGLINSRGQLPPGGPYGGGRKNRRRRRR